MHELGVALDDRRRKGEGARREARELADGALGAAFAADLEMHQVEAGREPRAEQAIEKRGDAADRLAAGPEQQDDRPLPAALRSDRGLRGVRPTPSPPSDPYRSPRRASERAAA